ncbi:MAG: beta-galactosidase, partial [Anaerolineae bacterium]|nr:beta-galactosidase [Anaerolineae bacterium]
ETDAVLMREAGLSVVRVGEFAWDKFEPQPGKYDFGWMDEAVDILAQEGLKIVMCTPTATPPPWLLTQHPEILRVEQNGVRVSPGGRRHCCANVPAYLRHSRRIVDVFTKHYGNHPALIGWQIDNEFGCGETTRCYCDHCRQRFHEWLQEKYGTLERLNAAWGTQFWGMTYHDWAEIPIPGITTEPQSPAMRLDYRRFSSDSWVRFQRMQIEFLRQNAPGRWITHNLMIRHWSLDYWKLAADLDIVSYDNYPHGVRGAAETAMNLDLMRSLKRKPFWIMEQQPGRVNWHPYNPPVPPGQVKSWSHQNIAHGAEAVVYFRFRAGRFGQEQYHAGLLKWDASRDQCFFEAQEVAAAIQNLPHLTRPQASVGIIFDYEDLWAIELEPVHRDFSYWQLVYEIYNHYWQASIPVDFLPREADLTGYE